MRKRIVSTLLAMVLVLSFASCGNTVPAMNENDSEKITEEVSEMIGDGTVPDVIIDREECASETAEAESNAED